MKRMVLFLLLICPAIICRAQTEVVKFKDKALSNNALDKNELKQQFISEDLSKLFTQTQNEFVYGFIGKEYQRIRVKLITVIKVPKTNNYVVLGKSMVKNNICNFKGTISVINIRKVKIQSYGVDDEFKAKNPKGEFVIVGDYEFNETIGQPHAGVFKGSFKTNFYLDSKNVVQYDNINAESDGFTNNQFVGEWKLYNSTFTQQCNWGDYRIPNSGNLDGGAGEFSPTDQYLKLGWQSVRDAHGNGPKAKEALKVEQAKWWE